MEDMAQNVHEQIVAKAGRFSAFSIACDESTDIYDSAQLLVFLQGVSEDFEVCQEFAGLETLSGTTKGTHISFGSGKSCGEEQLEVGKYEGHHDQWSSGDGRYKHSVSLHWCQRKSVSVGGRF